MKFCIASHTIREERISQDTYICNSHTYTLCHSKSIWSISLKKSPLARDFPETRDWIIDYTSHFRWDGISHETISNGNLVIFCFLSGRVWIITCYDFICNYGSFHVDVIKWKHFPRYRLFVRGIHRSPVNSPHKGQWRGALTFSLICAWINVWVNNLEAADLKRHPAHYDVIVMC